MISEEDTNMKKVCLALLLSLALCISGAIAEEATTPAPLNPEDCLGVWSATQAGSEGYMLPYALMGSEMNLEFFADGTVTVLDGENERTGSWTVDDQGVMTFQDATLIYKVSMLEEGTLVLDTDYLLIYLEREPAAAAEPLPEADTDVTQESFVGVWTLTEMTYNGATISVQDVYSTEVLMTINEDLTAVMAYAEEEPVALTWSFAGYTITITDGDVPVDATLHGGRLVMESDGKAMIFDVYEPTTVTE
jgi:hypothetical protein